MLIGFRAKVEAFAAKWERAGITGQALVDKVQSHNWAKDFPTRAGQSALTEAARTLKGLNQVAAKFNLSLEDLSKLLTSQATTTTSPQE